MARPLRIEFPGGVYHVTSRGDRREPIFGDDQDRACLIDILAQALDRFDGAMLAYCLMGNHYHLVLQTRRGNLSRLMRHVNGVYAQAFNRRHGLVGHLFQGRFTAIHVDRDAYLMEVCRYTELNPVRARMVDAVADWPWSSYRAHCGLAALPPWLDTAALHGHLLGRSASTVDDRLLAAELYAALVADGLGTSLWNNGLRQGIYLGEDAFIERTQARMRPVGPSTSEIPAAQRRKPAPAVSSFPKGAGRNECGMTMSQIARAAGLSVSRVSRLIARLEAWPDAAASAQGSDLDESNANDVG